VSPMLELVAVLSATLFAGAALYINLVEHPARLSCGTELALRQFAPSYRRATVMQVFLALVATGAGLAQWARAGGSLWLSGSLAIASVIPFTLIVIFPTNRKLLEPGRDAASPETRSLLDTWGRLHAVRSFLSLAASLLFAWAAVVG